MIKVDYWKMVRVNWFFWILMLLGFVIIAGSDKDLGLILSFFAWFYATMKSWLVYLQDMDQLAYKLNKAENANQELQIQLNEAHALNDSMQCWIDALAQNLHHSKMRENKQ